MYISLDISIDLTTKNDDDENSSVNNLEVVSNESLNINVNNNEEEFLIDEMPIVKNNNNSGDNSQENGDKSIFSVSRVKKVELSEIPLASDICSTRMYFSYFPLVIIYAHLFCISTF